MNFAIQLIANFLIWQGGGIAEELRALKTGKPKQFRSITEVGGCVESLT